MKVIRQRTDEWNIVRHVRVGDHFPFRDAERGSNGLTVLPDEFTARNGGERKTVPTLTSAAIRIARPESSMLVPAGTAFFTTATLSRTSTMMA
jgi:hypothetical protein